MVACHGARATSAEPALRAWPRGVCVARGKGRPTTAQGWQPNEMVTRLAVDDGVDDDDDEDDDDEG